MKIAIYKCEYGDVIREADEWIEKLSDYIRMSEIVEVDFAVLPKEETLAKELALIDLQIEEIQNQYGLRIENLQAKKQELLAIGNDND